MNGSPTPPSHRMLRRLITRTAAWAIPAIAAAQSTGTIAGTVTGESGPIQNARVAIESPTTAIAVTDAAGKYSLGKLPTGKYQLLITSIGYKAMRRSIDVAAGQTA